MDGSYNGTTGRAGYGELVISSAGDCIEGFSGSIGVTNCIHAELMAILKSLDLAWTRGFRKLFAIQIR